jgi:uncharacterized protein (DUF1800 family)
LLGSYFNKNDSSVVFERVDSVVKFNWRDGSPDEKVSKDYFGVVWQGYIRSPVSGVLNLSLHSSDRARLTLGGISSEDRLESRGFKSFNNRNKVTRIYKYSFNLEKGKLYPISITFREVINDASIKLFWAFDSERNRIVPNSSLFNLVNNPDKPENPFINPIPSLPPVFTKTPTVINTPSTSPTIKPTIKLTPTNTNIPKATLTPAPSPTFTAINSATPTIINTSTPTKPPVTPTPLPTIAATRTVLPPPPPPPTVASTSTPQSNPTATATPIVDGGTNWSDKPKTRAEASRFLLQATFGPTDATINRVMQIGYRAWLDEQLAMTGNRLFPRVNELRKIKIGAVDFYYNKNVHLYAWNWATLTGQDQLRQRMGWALSQIFVTSLQNPSLMFNYDPIIDYYDMLLDNSFVNYRKLLEDVSLHPAMGIYLSHIANVKDNPQTGARPDENYAREIMQLFSIGLWQLNPDGSLVLNSNGEPIPTYNNSDIEGLAKVFTGWSWGAMRGDWKNDIGFFSTTYGFQYGETWSTPMENYPMFNSTSEKKFLGVTIPAQSVSNAKSDLNTALNRLYNHQNTPAFISQRLIQHFVTSNPSPAYVERVAKVFENDGKGVRGNLGAVIKAVLLDNVARDPSMINQRDFGKLREPVLRISTAMRAFNYKSANGRWIIPARSVYFQPEEPIYTAGQVPMSAPTVFNYYKPGYTPPNSNLSRAGLLGPEFQIHDEVSTVNWVNAAETLVYVGAARNEYENPFTWDTWADGGGFNSESALADRPDALIDRITELVLAGKISNELRSDLREAINAIPVNSNYWRQERAKIAIFMTLSSPEYMVQK